MRRQAAISPQAKMSRGSETLWSNPGMDSLERSRESTVVTPGLPEASRLARPPGEMPLCMARTCQREGILDSRLWLGLEIKYMHVWDMLSVTWQQCQPQYGHCLGVIAGRMVILTWFWEKI